MNQGLHDGIYDRYRCPVCGSEIERDIVLFLNHTNRHIADLLGRGEESSHAEA